MSVNYFYVMADPGLPTRNIQHSYHQPDSWNREKKGMAIVLLTKQAESRNPSDSARDRGTHLTPTVSEAFSLTTGAFPEVLPQTSGTYFHVSFVQLFYRFVP